VWLTLSWVIRRDLMLAWRRRADVLASLFFFIIVISLFPLGVGAEREMLRTIFPGVVWVAALLASMLALGRLFESDYGDGTLEQMLLSSQPLYLIVLGKVVAQWLVAGLPLVLLAPIVGLQYAVPLKALWVLIGALLLGTPTLNLIGSIGAALTLGLRAANVLTALLVLPLFIPVLILGAMAVDAAMNGMSTREHLSLLGALLLMALVFAPWATAAGLRISME
jgi:heme exporter protein B